MGALSISILLISLTTTLAQRYRPNPEYKFSNSLQDFNHDLSGSRQTRRVISPGGNGRRPRYESDLEYDDYEDEDRAYAVGARIQVHHPTPKYQKINDDPSISSSFTKFKILHDNVPQKFKTNKQKSTKKPLFKSARDFDSESEEISSSEEFKSNFKRPKLSYPRELEEVASKKQIAQYLEDRQKLHDEIIQLRLLNDPNPGARAKYQQFLKAKDDERIEKEYEDDLKRKPFALFRPNIEPKRRLPRKNQQKITNIHAPPLSPPRKSSVGYNNGFRNSVPLSMTFHVDV